MQEQHPHINNQSETVVLTRVDYDALLANKQELEYQVLKLKHELDKLKRMIFGSKSERFIPSDSAQLQLFIEELEQKKITENQTESIAYTRNKTKKQEIVGHGRMPLPAHLPRTTVVIEPKENIEGAKKIGEEITEVLEYTPGKLFVKQYIRPKYVLPLEKNIVIGQLPSLPIPRGNVGVSLLAHIIVSKFVDHLPFYRQAKIFKRQNANIAETTINGWFSAGCGLLNSLYELHRNQILQSNYIMADETPIPVLSEDKPGATHRGYIWAYYDPINKNVLFDYQETRSGKCPTQMLKDFVGTIQSDGYNAYDAFEKQDGVVLLACMAHARRKFDDALNNDKTRAEQMLRLIQLLYEIEQEARDEDFSFEKRYALRQEKSIPILAEMEAWLKANILTVLPKSAIGKAIAYTLTLWKRLNRYVDDGKYEIDNNLIENSIRPIALGRKNYLFAGSHEAAQRIALIYSFMGTCKLQEVEPYAWLCDVLTKLPDTKQSELSNLLPSNWKPS